MELPQSASATLEVFLALDIHLSCWLPSVLYLLNARWCFWEKKGVFKGIFSRLETGGRGENWRQGPWFRLLLRSPHSLTSTGLSSLLAFSPLDSPAFRSPCSAGVGVAFPRPSAARVIYRLQ